MDRGKLLLLTSGSRRVSDQWQHWFASIPARKSVILFDTCDSGTLAGDETQELVRTAANDRLALATGRSILAASGGSQEAIEGYRGHGLFTYQVKEGHSVTSRQRTSRRYSDVWPSAEVYYSLLRPGNDGFEHPVLIGRVDY